MLILGERGERDWQGQVYCEKHFAEELQIPQCAGCDDLILDQELIAAEGRHWHCHHFCCSACGGSLAGSQYLMVEPGSVVCSHCWALTVRTCAGQDNDHDDNDNDSDQVVVNPSCRERKECQWAETATTPPQLWAATAVSPAD